MSLPNLEGEDLPLGVHRATLRETMERFGAHTAWRRSIARRLERIHRVATSTEHVARFVVFGSFVTAKPWPNDVDIFLLMDDAFQVDQITGEGRLLFDYDAAQTHFGRVSSGCGAPLHWTVSRPLSNTGRSSGTEVIGVSWKSCRSHHDRQ